MKDIVMFVDIPITERGRRYGYLIWPKSLESAVKQLLSGDERIAVILNGKVLGEKSIDWKRRRISLGPKQTRSIPEKTSSYRVQRSTDGTLDVRFEQPDTVTV